MIYNKMSEWFPHPKILLTIGLTALLAACLLVFAVYLIFSIYKLVKFHDVPMLLSIISIALALACLVTFCVMDIWSLYLDDPRAFLNTALGTNVTEQIDALKVMFIFCAFVFDLYKWCIFVAATSQTISVNKDLLQVRHKQLQVALVGVQSLIVATSLTFSIAIIATSPDTEKDDSSTNDAWQNAQFLFISSTFGIFLMVYTLVLILLISRLKRYFPHFYKKEKRQIFLASVSVMVSILARMAINIVYSIDSVDKALNLSF